MGFSYSTCLIVAALLLNVGVYAADTDRVSQVHLGVTPTAGEVTVSWATQAADSSASCTVVQYGTSEKLGSSATGNSTTYTLITYTSPLLHTVTLKGLAADTKHYYRAGCDNGTGVWSDVYSFTTPPAAPSGRITLGLLGDHGHTNNSQATLQRMMAASPAYDVIVHAGDISYANGWQPTWDEYMNLIQPLASGTPWMTTVGNHEYVDAPVIGVLPNLKSYDARFAMPRANTPAKIEAGAPTSRAHVMGEKVSFATNLYYSVDIGPVHLIALNSEVSSFAPNSTQFEWLEADLAAANKNRDAVPWILATWHRPWESSNHVHGNDTTMRDAWEPSFIAGKVDVVLNGHVHAYERTYPMAGGNIAQPGQHGIVYLTCGHAGNGEGLYTNWETPTPPFSAHHAAVFGHCALDVLNATHAQFTMIRNSDGGVEDATMVVRSSAEV